MKILIIDDHPLFLHAIQSLLKELVSAVEFLTAHSRDTAMDLAQKNPDINLVLLDLQLPDTHGIDLLPRIQELLSNIPIVMLSASTRLADMQKCLSSGAKGYICKSAAPPVILNALNLVLAGGIYIPPEMIRETDHESLLRQGSTQHQPLKQPEVSLTPRQHQVLELLIDGKGRSNKEIANIIGCSEATIKVHVTAVLKALRVTNRIQLQSAAKELGLLNEQRRATDQTSST